MAQAARKATYQDVLDAIVLGDAFWLGRSGPGGWVIVAEQEIHLIRDQRVLVPDFSGWRTAAAAELPLEAIGIEVVPEWICEVLSPTTSRHDRLRKLPLYAEHGVAWLWLLDPAERSLEIYRRGRDGYLLLQVHGEAKKIRAPPFDAIELDFGSLWPEPDAPAAK